MVDGKRVRRSFTSPHEAAGALEAAKAEQESHGKASLAVTPLQRVELGEWLAQLPEGVSMGDVFRFWLLHHGGPVTPPVSSLVSSYVTHLEELKRSPKYCTFSGSVLRRFFACGQKLSQITREAIAPFVAMQKSVPAQKNTFGVIRAFFEWCVENRYTPINPAKGTANRIRFAAVQEKPILCLSAKDAQKLLRVCMLPHYFPFLGFVTAAMFLGVRPEEIYRTPIENLDLSERFFKVAAVASKTGQKRVIPLCDTAHKWFSLWVKYKESGTAFRPSNFQKQWKAIRDEAGVLDAWEPDLLRHTFASMHLARWQDSKRLKYLMGHTQTEDTLFRHYSAIETIGGETVTQSMAEQFWNLTPHAKQTI